MKKRTYRAVPVKELDWEGLAQRLPDRLIVGIDVAKKTMFGTLMTPNEEILAVVKWDHLSETRWFASQLAGLPAVAKEVAMEPSGTYGDALRQCLNSSGLEVSRVSPKQVKDSREIYDGVPSSHDAKCSAIVAWLHLLGRSSAWPECEDKVRAAKAAKHPSTSGCHGIEKPTLPRHPCRGAWSWHPADGRCRCRGRARAPRRRSGPRIRDSEGRASW